MSIEKHTEEVPATTRTSTVTVCDCCGAKTEIGEEWPAETDWAQSASTKVTVEFVKTHVGYEMDGKHEGLAWDFCPSCFEAKVRPLLETLAKPRKVYESW